MKRVLLIAQDNLLKSAPGVRVDYLPTGARTTPGETNPEHGFSIGLATLCLLRLLRRGYNWLILPVMEFTSPYRERRNRSVFRRALGIVGWKPFGGRTIFEMAKGRRTPVCVIDRDDRAGQLYLEYADAVGASVYLKTNILQSDLLQRSASGCRFARMPMWLPTDQYPLPAAAKEYDLFFAASLDSESRRRALTEISRLREDGVRALVPEMFMPFRDYALSLSRSWLTISPEGLGFHCFRHYEAMLMGSVPVINRPTQPISTGLADGENCLAYDMDVPGDLARVVTTALADRARLAAWGRRLRDHAMDHHSIAAAGKFLAAQTYARDSSLEPAGGRVTRQSG